MSVPLTALEALYAGGDDPWDFRTSPYEQARFAVTAAALARRRYASCLEIGCGNGSLARHLAARCDRYAGLDGVERALEAARASVPSGRFVRGFYPCDLPGGDHDLSCCRSSSISWARRRYSGSQGNSGRPGPRRRSSS